MATRVTPPVATEDAIPPEANKTDKELPNNFQFFQSFYSILV